MNIVAMDLDKLIIPEWYAGKESETEYCQLIIDRWEAATGKTAERL